MAALNETILRRAVERAGAEHLHLVASLARTDLAAAAQGYASADVLVGMYRRLVVDALYELRHLREEVRDGLG